MKGSFRCVGTLSVLSIALVVKIPDCILGGNAIPPWSYKLHSPSHASWLTIDLLLVFMYTIRPAAIGNGASLLKGCHCEVADSDR